MENVSRAIPCHSGYYLDLNGKASPADQISARHFPSIHQSSTLYSPGDAETFLSEERSFETSKAGKKKKVRSDDTRRDYQTCNSNA